MSGDPVAPFTIEWNARNDAALDAFVVHDRATIDSYILRHPDIDIELAKIPALVAEFFPGAKPELAVASDGFSDALFLKVDIPCDRYRTTYEHVLTRLDEATEKWLAISTERRIALDVSAAYGGPRYLGHIRSANAELVGTFDIDSCSDPVFEWSYDFTPPVAIDLYRDGEIYVAVCTDFGIEAPGADLDDAQSELAMIIATIYHACVDMDDEVLDTDERAYKRKMIGRVIAHDPADD